MTENSRDLIYCITIGRHFSHDLVSCILIGCPDGEFSWPNLLYYHLQKLSGHSHVHFNYTVYIQQSITTNGGPKTITIPPYNTHLFSMQ